MVQIRIKRLNNQSNALPLPTYHSAHAAGMDLCAEIDQPVFLEAGQRKLIPTGIAIEIPGGYEAQIRPRSGLAIKKGIGLINSPGTIDADYRGEIQIIVINLGDEQVRINRGDRIAQMVISPVIQAEVIEVKELNESGRSSGGFGSTGVSPNIK